MDFVENVGRRSRVNGDNGDFINVGIFSLNGYERNALYQNQGGGCFAEVGYLAGCDRVEDGRGLGFLDADQDGDLDIAINNYLQPARLLINQAPPENHWIRFRLQGTRSNRSAIGARVVLEHGARRQVREVTSSAGYLSGQSLTLHFGLGLDREVERVTVRWPSGRVEELRNLRADRLVPLIEGQVGPASLFSKK
ncbi:MAG: ASPIC/UnbV domain-containing protein [Planctomycetes bacterium]|nr:ASPIC/UnbV domain-containing protein [Planctomycetota bacterium]